MDFSRTQSRLVSLTVSAMITASFLATAPGSTISAAAGPQPAVLTTALEGLRASGWRGLQSVPPPTVVDAPASFTPVSIPPKSPLSATEVQSLGQLLVKFGKDIAIDSSVTTALGLTPEGATLTLRQMGILRDRTGHAYQVTADGGFLIMTGSVEGARIYRANPKQELIAAVSKKTGFAPVAIPAPDAQRELDAEFAFWAAIADAP